MGGLLDVGAAKFYSLSDVVNYLLFFSIFLLLMRELKMGEFLDLYVRANRLNSNLVERCVGA